MLRHHLRLTVDVGIERQLMFARVRRREREFAGARAFLRHDAVVIVEDFVYCDRYALEHVSPRNPLVLFSMNALPYLRCLCMLSLGRSIAWL